MNVDEEPREGMLLSFYEFAKADKCLITADKVDKAVVVVVVVVVAKDSKSHKVRLLSYFARYNSPGYIAPDKNCTILKKANKLTQYTFL